MSSAIATNGSSQIVELLQPRTSPLNSSCAEGVAAGKWDRVFTSPGRHPFQDIEWKIVDAVIKKPDGSVVFEQKGIEVPAWWNQNTVNVVADKYLRVIKGVRETSVKQMLTRVCSTIRAWAHEQDYFETQVDADIFEVELIHALLHQYGAFNSPVWFNLGVPDRRQAASACFISAVDDTLDDIMDFQKSEMTIFRGGSGSGANLSSLRSSYEKISSGSYTSGPISWMRGLNEYAGAAKSGGSTRNAAKMVVLDMDHPDILDTRDGRPGFIRCKSWAEKMAHDLIQAGYSAAYDDPNGAYKIVPYQNGNHSVSIPDAFMKAVLDDREWETRERLTGSTVHKYQARDLWKEIAEAAWFCGDPGVQFTDTINKWHTTPMNGRIRSSNPCSEFLHVDNTACNLCAINLTKFFNGSQFDAASFNQAVRLFVTSQNALIAKADYPSEAITKNSHALRPIGLNYGDLGALLMNLGYSYDSDGGRAVAARMASLMTGTAYLVSAKLAARVGAFSEFAKNKEYMLNVMRMHEEADLDIVHRWNLERDPISDTIAHASNSIWRDAIAHGEKFGYTISQATLQAPLGTISFLMGMSTTGIEPAFSLVSYKSLVGGGFMKIVNSGVQSSLRNLGYNPSQVQDIVKYIEEKDFIEGAPGLDPKHLSVFDCAMPAGPSGRCISPIGHLKMMAAIQPLITCAQSKTVNLPKEVTAKEIADIYFESWKLGLKCVALYRDGCKWSQPLSTKKDDPPAPEPVSGIREIIKEVVKEVHVNKRRFMPEDRVGSTHKFTIDGHKGYITINEYGDGSPGEVFIRLGKNGSTMAGLMDAFTKLLSIALQYNVPLDELIRGFTNVKFDPSGFTLNSKIRFTDSPVDYLFKLLDLRYFDGECSGIGQKAHKVQAASPVRSQERARTTSIDAPPCNKCGTITQRNGSCYLCPTCGSSTGCS